MLVPSEHEESVMLAQWLDFKNLLYSKIPSETYITGWKQKHKNTEEGVHKGVPDYIIIINASQCSLNRSVILFIELKKKKGGKISEEQKKWIEELNKVADVEAHVCKGSCEAIKIISELLK